MKNKILLLSFPFIINACVTTDVFVERAPVATPIENQINQMGNRIEKLLISLSRSDDTCKIASDHNLNEQHPLMKKVDFKFEGDGLKAIDKLAQELGVKTTFVGKHLVPIPNVFINVTNQTGINILELITSKIGVNLVEVIYIEDERLIEVRSLGRAERKMTGKKSTLNELSNLNKKSKTSIKSKKISKKNKTTKQQKVKE